MKLGSGHCSIEISSSGDMGSWSVGVRVFAMRMVLHKAKHLPLIFSRNME
jgi:hypothetical protein